MRHDSLLAYLNGEYLPRGRPACRSPIAACCSATACTRWCRPMAAGRSGSAHHLQRLDRSLASIRMDNPLSHEEWRQVFERLTGQLPGQDQSIYLQVTRGAYPIRNHVIPAEDPPNVLAFISPNPPRDAEKAQQGIRVITLDDIRWHRCDIKATALLANVLARAQATEEGADEAILIRDGAPWRVPRAICSWSATAC